MKKEKIKKGLRDLKKVQGILTDEQALECPNIYPDWTGEGKAYAVGDKVLYGDKLYKCLQDHESQSAWNPVDAPSLWAEILAGQDGTDIGEWVQPDSTNAYMTGDKVTHNGKTWESTVDNNVWEPGVYGWIEVTEG